MEKDTGFQASEMTYPPTSSERFEAFVEALKQLKATGGLPDPDYEPTDYAATLKVLRHEYLGE